MRSILVIVALCVAVSAIPYKFNHDIKINVYDVFKSLYFAAPMSACLERFAKDGQFKFTEDFFHYYPEKDINEMVVLYKPIGADYLHGYYVKSEDVTKYDDKFFNTVHPFYEYLNSGDYYAFTPLAAKQLAPEYFNMYLKKIFYEYYGDLDLNRSVPFIFLVPKSEVSEVALKNYILMADYVITTRGTHDIREYFEKAGKAVARRDLVSPFYPYLRTDFGYPYTYGYNPYYYNSYYKGYPYYSDAYRYYTGFW